MTHRLKARWLAPLLAVFAAIALVSTNAFAEEEEGGVKPGRIVAFEFPLILDGTDVEGGTNAFTILGEEIICPDSSYTGLVEEKTPSEFTLTPTYTSCSSGGGGHKVTISMNGCDYHFHIEKTTTTIEDNYFTSFDLVCPEEHDVEIHKYVNASNESGEACKITIKPQIGIRRAKLTNITLEGDVTLETSFKNITASKSGACGEEETNKGEYHVDITLTGTNEAKEPRNFKIIDP